MGGRILLGMTTAALLLATRPASAGPMPFQVTYSTSAGIKPPQYDSYGGMVFGFRPVVDAVATVGSEIKLGTFMIRIPDPGPGSTFQADVFPFIFQGTKVGNVAAWDGTPPWIIHSPLYGTLNQDGTVAGSLVHSFLTRETNIGPRYFAGAMLSIWPAAVPGRWHIDAETQAVAVDIYGKLHGQIVPEPAAWATWGVVGIGACFARRRARAPKSR